MSFRRPSNPALMSIAKFRYFDGIGGPLKQLLRRFNERGQDISNSIANEVTDFDLLQVGSMIKRNGSRKTNTTGEAATVTNVIPVSVGSVLAYGVVVAGALKIITMPTVNVRLNPLELSPANATPALATHYTSTDPSIWY